MDINSRLGSLFVFCLAIFQVQLGRTHLIVHMDVSGDYVVKTGIRKYTVSTYYRSHVVIKCSSRPFSSHLVLWRNNQPITVGVRNYADEITLEKYFSQQRENRMVEKYHCASSITKGIFNDSYAHFTVWSEVEIRTQPDSLLCASSVGRLGYVGEKTTVQCMSVYVDYGCRFEGQWSWNITKLKVLSNTLSESSCNCNYYRSCSLHTISVVESVIVNIFNTGNMTQADPSFAEFACTSNPPRLMFWTVFGADGILFDFNKLNTSAFKVKTTVNITQVPGNTTLRISESVRGGNGIHTVICSTIDTESRVVALHFIQHQLVKTLDCDLSSVKTTQMQVTTSTSDNPTSIGEDSTFEITTTEALKDSKDNDMNPTDQGTEMKRDAANDYFLMTIVGLPLLGTNLVLMAAVYYLHKKTRYNAGIKAQVLTPSTVSPDIELHDNPTYLAFNETEDTLCNEKEKTECTYANV